MCYQLGGVVISEGLGGVYIRRNIQTCDIIGQSEGRYIGKLRVRIFENIRFRKREQLATDVEGHHLGGQSWHLVKLCWKEYLSVQKDRMGGCSDRWLGCHVVVAARCGDAN